MKSIEERMAIVEPLLGFSFVTGRAMNPGGIQNRVIGGSCTSFDIPLNNLSYRGVWISTIEDISLQVDGEDIPKSNMMFFCNGINYSILDMVGHTENFWGCRDQAVLRVYRIGGLSKGQHTISLTIFKRSDFGHSYGNGTEGYEDAHEFHQPSEIKDSCTITIA